jgi:ribosomal protein S18 acetylase RimI-like enzyme
MMNIREFRFPEDYPPTLNLWQGIEMGVKVGRSDSLEEIEKKIQRDPDLFLLAEADGEIIGSIIGGYDGRRGLIYHLAVRQDFRKQGVGDMLLAEVEKRMQAKGCIKCYLLVLEDNERAMQFYENRGWSDMKDIHIFGKEFAK